MAVVKQNGDSIPFIKQKDFIIDYFAPSEEITLDDVFLQLIDAFCYIESHGISHRDIRKGKTLIDKTGTVKAIDFGIGKQQKKLMETLIASFQK